MLQRRIISILIAAAVFFPTTSQAGIDQIFKGWGWNSVNTGWVSVNAINTSVAPTQDYGVTVDTGNNVTGWAWSSNLGWICFGTTCPGDPPGVPVTSWALMNSVTGELTGWARVYSLYTLQPAGEQGWISLNCKNIQGDPCPGATAYSVTANLTDGFLRGYGWNSTATGAAYSGGIGWVRFDPLIPTQTQYVAPYAGALGVVPWVQVKQGSVYSRGNISTPSEFTTIFGKKNTTISLDPNAAFCLDKGTTSTITRFAAGTCVYSLSSNLTFPKSTSSYVTTLGRIDVPGIQSNRFGSTFAYPVALPAVFGGGIYMNLTNGNYMLGGYTFANGAGTVKGNGLLIVRGNLTITGNILYNNSVAPAKLKNLASFGIMVLDDPNTIPEEGNITIDPGVLTVSANIYAEGTLSTGSWGNPAAENPLTINGVVVAHKINFQRQYIGNAVVAAETIVADGRIVANPPPGMVDFVQALPKIPY